jgi:hypothetical protein
MHSRQGRDGKIRPEWKPGKARLAEAGTRFAGDGQSRTILWCGRMPTHQVVPLGAPSGRGEGTAR